MLVLTASGTPPQDEDGDGVISGAMLEAVVRLDDVDEASTFSELYEAVYLVGTAVEEVDAGAANVVAVMVACVPACAPDTESQTW